MPEEESIKKEKKMKDRVIGPKHVATTNRQNFNNDVIRQSIMHKKTRV